METSPEMHPRDVAVAAELSRVQDGVLNASHLLEGALDARRVAIRAALEAGWSYGQIGRLLGITRQAVRKAV